jgi:hypothetical protein
MNNNHDNFYVLEDFLVNPCLGGGYNVPNYGVLEGPYIVALMGDGLGTVFLLFTINEPNYDLS